MLKGVPNSFQYFLAATAYLIWYRVKGCVVTADLRAGKRWIGVGTAWSGIASWVFFYECPPWGAMTIWVVIIWPTFNGMAYTYLVNY
mgnify:CR=1 FL=1